MKRVRWMAGAAFIALVGGLVPSVPNLATPMAEAQNFGQRAVTGSVVNDASTLLTGATVFLRNQKNKSIRSYTTAADGRFRFAQVDMSQDFDLWAEKDNKKSAIKTVSSWDSRKALETELKIK